MVNIGDRVSNNRMYSGIKFFDGMPLTSRDIHEVEDTLLTKLKLLTDTVIGTGMINSPTFAIDESGNLTSDEITLLINGDINVVAGSPLVTKYNLGLLTSDDHTDYALFICGWYEPIGSNSKVFKYGGVLNGTLENDLLDPTLGVQATSRYQFRWFPTVAQIDSADTKIEDIETINIRAPYYNANSDTFTYSVNNATVYSDYTNTGLGYFINGDNVLIPVAKINTEVNTVTAVLPTMPKGSSLFIKQEAEPTGTYSEGTIWYNPTTKKFKTYITDEGFLETAPDMCVKINKIYEYTVPSGETPSRVSWSMINLGTEMYGCERPINPEYQVTLNGLLLTRGLHYKIEVNYGSLTEDYTPASNETLEVTEPGTYTSGAVEFIDFVLDPEDEVVINAITVEKVVNAKVYDNDTLEKDAPSIVISTWEIPGGTITDEDTAFS